MPAAVTDAYAVAADYRARIDKTDTSDDTVLDAILLAVTRLLNKETGRFFTKDAAAVTRLFHGSEAVPGEAEVEGERLYVVDIAETAGLVVKVDLDDDNSFGGSDETLTLDTHFWLGPLNADKGPEPQPFRFLEVLRNNTRLSRWPDRPRSVQVDAKFGWPAVPGAIKEATILICREMVDLQKAGFTLNLQNLDQSIQLSPAAFGILQRIKRVYGARGGLA
jgi:hypothetical protein